MMKKIKECNNYIKKIAAFFILMIIIFNSGCAGTKFNSYSKKVIYPSVSTNDIQIEIEKQQNFLKKAITPDVKADIYLELAILYSYYKNMSPDYELALKSIDKYRKLKPIDKQLDEVKYFSSLLLYINKLKIRCDKLKSRKKQVIIKPKKIVKKDKVLFLDKKIKLLKQKNRELNKDITLQKEIIEKLKRIDIRSEKKRLK